MAENPMLAVGSPDLLQVSLGLTPEMAAQIGAIAIFAGNVEFRLERAIWRLENHTPKGVRHATDAKPIGELVEMFRGVAAKRLSGNELLLVELWCDTAGPAFDFRHSIVHGAAFRIDPRNMHIERNRSWEGEIRKRPAASLWGDKDSFAKIRLTFAVLLRVINSISNPQRTLQEIASPERLHALRSAKSLMGEMASGYGPWFEKY